MDADVVIDADATPCAVLQASRTVYMHPSPRIAGRGCQRRIRGDGARAREWRECRQRREQVVVRLHASRSPLIRLSATFTPPSGEKESRYASRTVYMHPSPRIAGRGCQRRVRGDGARANEAEGVRPTPRTGCTRGFMHRARPSSGPESGTGQALRPLSPRGAGRRALSGESDSSRRGYRASDPRRDALAAKLDEARASHNGTHVVAVAVHLDPEGRCCGADHPRSVARCSQRPRQRRRVIDRKLRAGSHEQVNIRCLARAITAGTRSVTGWRQAPRRAGAQRRRAMSPRWCRPMPPGRRRAPPPGPTRRTVRLRTPHSRRNSGERMRERPRQVPTCTSHSHSAQPSCSSAISSASA